LVFLIIKKLAKTTFYSKLKIKKVYFINDLAKLQEMAKVIQGSNSKKYVLEKVIGQGSFGKVYLSGDYAIK